MKLVQRRDTSILIVHLVITETSAYEQESERTGGAPDQFFGMDVSSLLFLRRLSSEVVATS